MTISMNKCILILYWYINFHFYLQNYAQTQLDEKKIPTQGFTPMVPSTPSTPLPLSSTECVTPNKDMLGLSATNQSHNMVLDNTILVTAAVMITTSCTTTTTLTSLVRPTVDGTTISQASLNKLSSKIDRQKKEPNKKNKKSLEKAPPSDIICGDNTSDSKENKVSKIDRSWLWLQVGKYSCQTLCSIFILEIQIFVIFSSVALRSLTVTGV